MIEKEFVPYEQALALKELGFDEPCFGRYIYDGRGKEWFLVQTKQIKSASVIFEGDISVGGISVASPLYQQAFRWFREKYGWQHSIDATSDQHSFELGYNYWIWNYKTGEEYHTMPKNRPSGDWEYKTYEEAELACLNKLIEIVKNQ